MRDDAKNLHELDGKDVCKNHAGMPAEPT